MALPLLRFVAFYDSCVITVLNLESLTVAQIRSLETFAEARRSRLDFNTATIRIWKRIDFAHFNRILELEGIAADTVEAEVAVKKPEEPAASAAAVAAVPSPRIGFGKHKGMLYGEIPQEYLLWLKGNYSGPERSAIEQELKRRNL